MISAINLSLAYTGSWYPVFFSKFDYKELITIIDTLQKGGCASICYPKQKKRLAHDIEVFFKDNGFILTSQQSDDHDNNQVQYNQQVVVVTVWNSCDNVNLKGNGL